jgi:predicted amidohydrolase
LEPLGYEYNYKAIKLPSIDNDDSNNLQSDLAKFELGLDDLISLAYTFIDYLPFEKRSEKINIIKNRLNGLSSPHDKENDLINKRKNILSKEKIIRDAFIDVQKNLDIPRLVYHHLSGPIKDSVTVATVQIGVELTDFPYKIKDEYSNIVKSKIYLALKKAREENVNIVCFPELSFSKEWVNELIEKQRQESDKMIIISGSYYDDKYNTCKIISDFGDADTPPQIKMCPSPKERSIVRGEERMLAGERIIHIYGTEFGNFSVLICRDFAEFVNYLRGNVDLIFVPSCNTAKERFDRTAHDYITNNPSYIVFSNTAKYGGTSIFGQLDRDYFDSLVDSGCKKKDDMSYKLCEIGEGKEGMIVAEFNLKYKTPQKQKPSDYRKEIINVWIVKKLDNLDDNYKIRDNERTIY